MKNTEKLFYSNEWKNWLYLPICKCSGKPFKSGKKIGIPFDIVINEHSNKTAFLMNDGSVVDCYQCILVNEDKFDENKTGRSLWYDAKTKIRDEKFEEMCIIWEQKALDKAKMEIKNEKDINGKISDDTLQKIINICEKFDLSINDFIE